ncbi:hypothetical protein BC351_23840 [Paenibacillus ferrarius]|uniref:Glycoside hydrolase n=1 Tax=Paenibacillus ferrarius TaxID=1469647 RepID=A0A1V4HLW0_9BACL|nr:glycoside hydrolase family 88 protein [Paenibacillus ferrarius]OPH58469.1 hypothetical protein BC351_23840 [Paenibacillus ferrarius]
MKNYPYFHENESIAGKVDHEEEILAAVAGRFIGSHPKHRPIYRIHTTNGFRRGEDYRYEMNLVHRWPELENGQYVYVWGKLWSDVEAEHPFSVSCFSPVRVFMNQSLQFVSNLNDDVFPERIQHFRSKLHKGWNHILLEFVKTETGCGGKFGTGSVKGFPMHILAPTSERQGQEGWVYSEPQAVVWSLLPDEETDVLVGQWHPKAEWSPEEMSLGCFARIFGHQPESIAYAWTKLESRSANEQSVHWNVAHNGPVTIFLDGKPVHEERNKAGSFVLTLPIAFGTHDIVIRSACVNPVWGFTMELAKENKYINVKMSKPRQVEGMSDHWLYAGTFRSESAPQPSEIIRMDTLIGTGLEQTFWRADLPEAWVRPYLENTIYGKWNYPLGVTLYGILKTGLQLENSYFTSYAMDHIELCTSFHAYSLWDRKQYGSPGMNHQLALIDSLDDCGSFGAAMLEANKARQLTGVSSAAARIAQYITAEQSRLADGALYRMRGTTDFMKDTVWCDDLYMSTPFLSKYYELTGESSYLNDAAMQFLLYKQLLFIPELKIMHHVYDFKFQKGNGVPWGRGNGWVLFSLTELLAVMPEKHEHRPELLKFFCELCEGYRQLQGTHGLWHQVLTDPTSYEEASCTSMFIYAFARGVRFGWLDDSETYIEAVLKGWEGLTRSCIDKNGNVYGVCRGSGYSFNSYYYKDQLSWQLNDTHGIGIVLLAGIELIKMKKHLRGQETDQYQQRSK